MKTFYKILFLLVLASISACNDSDSKSESKNITDRSTKAGYLMGGDAQGIRYKTETQSGLTDSNGAFYYRQGELVTFSIGGIQLGIAEGAENISLFDFFNMEPPSTERALRKEFENTEVTDFDRVINIGLLLAFLDEDNDPTNGLDLTGWDETLVDERYSFERNFYSREYDFYEYLEDKYNFDSSTHRRATIEYIYNNLNILIPVQAEITFSSSRNGNPIYFRRYFVDDLGDITGYEEDTNGDGIINYYTNESVDENNLVTTYESKSDVDGDGIFESKSLDFFEYDANGNTISAITEEYFPDGSVRREEAIYTYHSAYQAATTYLSVDYNNDGSLEEIRESSSSENGDILSRSEKSDYDRDGIYDYILEYEATYDVEGNQLSSKETITRSEAEETTLVIKQTESTYDSYGNVLSHVETEKDQDGNVFAVEEVVANYDSDGNQLDYLIRADGDRDGETDFIYSVVSTYDQAGNKLSATQMIDANRDGEFDESHQTIATYDANGNTLTYRSQEDSDLDGDYEYVSEELKTFDSNGNQLSFIDRIDFNGDGVYDSVDENIKTYDAQSRVLTEIYKQDSDGDGLPELIEENSKTYDSEGRILDQIERIDWDGDGIFDRAEKTVKTYDQRGFEIHRQHLSDYDGDGTYDSLEETLRSYDDRRNLLSRISRSDYENDGVYEYISETVHTYDGDQLLTSKQSEDYNGDGNPETVYFSENTFDEKGNLLFDSTKRDDDGDGVYEDIRELEYTYDQAGRQVSLIRRHVENNNIIYFYESETIYDGFGQDVKTVYSSDGDGDGVIDTQNIVEKTFGENGELLTTNEVRMNEGRITSVDSTERTYRTLEDGLYYLYSEYIWYFVGL